MKKTTKNLLTVLFVLGSFALTSCRTTVVTGPTYSWRTSPFASIDQFVDSLNYIDNTYDILGYGKTYVELYDTWRTVDENLDDWFVIWDSYYSEYKAISLQYIRTIEYYDYISNTDSLAAEFRYIEADDIADGYGNGNYWDYEVVDYDFITDSFWGRVSGFEYEDEAETTDVNLMAAKKEQAKFIKKAAAVSAEYKLDIKKSLSLVSLGYKMKAMKKSGDLSISDLTVLAADVKSLTGVGVEEFVAASTDPAAKENLLKTAAKSLKTTSSNIEQKLLPELFGIEL